MVKDDSSPAAESCESTTNVQYQILCPIRIGRVSSDSRLINPVSLQSVTHQNDAMVEMVGDCEVQPLVVTHWPLDMPLKYCRL